MSYIRQLGMFASGRWCQLPYDFLDILPCNEAILLAHVCNLAHMECEDERNQGEWTRLTTKDIQKKLRRFTAHKIERLLRSLREAKVLQSKLVTSKKSKQRWVRVNAEILNQLIENKGEPLGAKVYLSTLRCKSVPKGGCKSVPTTLVSTCTKQPCRSEESIATEIDSEGGTSNGTGIDGTYKEGKRIALHTCLECKGFNYATLAKQICGTIRQVRKMATSPAGFVVHFKKLHVYNEVPIARINRAVAWYCKAILEEGDLIGRRGPNKAMIPIAFGGKAFYDKFGNIEMAMRRAGVNVLGKDKKKVGTVWGQGRNQDLGV